ncbi:hypothetical protein AVEN_197731-1 [Araneus ventricosus]|uniref:Uncharacterized protein n=1 Tax=Araneus ventricosus TaxID=182803 RepID=A0A4Y2CMM4_ARAVE|nr:hypothetical protein AVEN_197731-1 [Araneus ventricosus]
MEILKLAKRKETRHESTRHEIEFRYRFTVLYSAHITKTGPLLRVASGLPSTGLEVSVTQVYLVTTKKIEPSLVSFLFRRTLPKNSQFSSLALLFNSLALLLGGGPEKSLQQITVNSVAGVHLSEPIGSLPYFGACPFVASGFSDSR